MVALNVRECLSLRARIINTFGLCLGVASVARVLFLKAFQPKNTRTISFPQRIDNVWSASIHTSEKRSKTVWNISRLLQSYFFVTCSHRENNIRVSRIERFVRKYFNCDFDSSVSAEMLLKRLSRRLKSCFSRRPCQYLAGTSRCISLIIAVRSPGRSSSRRGRRLGDTSDRIVPADRLIESPMTPMTRVASRSSHDTRSCVPVHTNAHRERATRWFASPSLAKRGAPRESKQAFQSDSGANGAECSLRGGNRHEDHEEVKAGYFCRCRGSRARNSLFSSGFI